MELVPVNHFDVTAVHHVTETHWDPKCGKAVKLATFDIVEMYTRMLHGDISKLAKMLLEMVAQKCGNDFYVPRGKRKKAALGIAPCNSQAYQATFVDVLVALEFELTYAVFTAGTQLLAQNVGLPIGGVMAPFGARAVCVMCEHEWLQDHSDFRGIL